MTAAKKIVFQGEPGANSHLAAREVYPDHEPVPCATFEDALAAVKRGAAKLAMIPIENSVAGRVADIHHLMPTAWPADRLPARLGGIAFVTVHPASVSPASSSMVRKSTRSPPVVGLDGK